MTDQTPAVNLFKLGMEGLLLESPAEKTRAVQQLYGACSIAGFYRDSSLPSEPLQAPGRPQYPELVEPARVKKRRLGTEQGRAALIHAIAHIEFNAINLALDAICRFRDLPDRYYIDWLSVAADESRHFLMLEQRLAELGYQYGDFPAHDGLWQMAEQTAHDVLVRMALVPRVLEARGLDVTPGMIMRLESAGDNATAAILKIILEEEIRHVEIGSHWFKWLCEERGQDPDTTFFQLLEQFYGKAARGPYNHEARRRAGFSAVELHNLEHMGK